MRHIRHAFPITIGFVAATASVLFACADDDPVTPPPDSGTPAQDASKPDTGTPTDSGGGTDTGIDTGVDAGVDTGIDAAPTMTSSNGATGSISVGSDFVIATFYEDDTILRWSNAPSCVVFVRGPSKPTSAAGTLTVGGAIVGSDGGTDQTITVAPDTSAGNGYFFVGPVYPPVDTYTVNVQLSAQPGFAAMPVETFRPSRETPVPITAPAQPDASTPPGIPSTAPYTITWTAPTGGFVNEQQISVSLVVSAGGTATSKLTQLFCTFPLSAGTATIPANVLTEMKTRSGGADLDGTLHIYAGGAKEVKNANGSYVVEVARQDSTSLVQDFPIKLQ